ncbi:tRNA uridine-5-carboxymethylaminomethyl(34) synthesis GTPase MnmE [Chitinivibrio alkaliphilus]|uniref:tRNA modification GTPase MnmE n=1 Tax=Chitinivibrio alkaliphilus ACht1 TaxID=1313304 RepID=U7D5K3_9BACT|nr:tRNA uridine-5-carboxymethylaminomethyl(34) synthesis GTPase MnmE [Chitinivibrio alkaliphilus]ERP31809.1 tRNA modification GTPase TrmE [Chitinivibrio alkaliphilus ACht1]
MVSSDTIVALATPRGNAALAVLRISGPDAHALCADFIQEKKRFETASPGQLRRYLLCAKGEVIDEITAVKFSAPRSFTGEDMVELICHGGTTLLERIISLFLSTPLRYADPGEFSRRAFLHGKLDLKKAESIHRLIHAESVQAHKNALAHYLGQERPFFDALKDDIHALLVDMETAIEFSDTDDVGESAAFTERMEHLLQKIHRDFEKELEKRQRLREIDTGVDVCIVGRANAGKSSLLNALLGYDRAIINARKGTTRDIITETRLLGGMRVRFIDTAGLNETTDEIEQEGIRRTQQAIAQSALVVWLVSEDSGCTPSDFSAVSSGMAEVLGVANKCDSPQVESAESFLTKHGVYTCSVSARTGEGVSQLLREIETRIHERYCDVEYETVIGTEREEALVRRIVQELDKIDLGTPMEIQAEYLRSILSHLESIYGKSSPEEVLNDIFGSFCIGK